MVASNTITKFCVWLWEATYVTEVGTSGSHNFQICKVSMGKVTKHTCFQPSVSSVIRYHHCTASWSRFGSSKKKIGKRHTSAFIGGGGEIHSLIQRHTHTHMHAHTHTIYTHACTCTHIHHIVIYTHSHTPYTCIHTHTYHYHTHPQVPWTIVTDRDKKNLNQTTWCVMKKKGDCISACTTYDLQQCTYNNLHWCMIQDSIHDLQWCMIHDVQQCTIHDLQVQRRMI